jgi:hypothetical protein
MQNWGVKVGERRMRMLKGRFIGTLSRFKTICSWLFCPTILELACRLAGRHTTVYLRIHPRKINSKFPHHILSRLHKPPLLPTLEENVTLVAFYDELMTARAGRREKFGEGEEIGKSCDRS